MKKTIKVPFDVEKAKAGARVVTRDGRNARIICYDRDGLTPIVALIRNEKESVDSESIYCYPIAGVSYNSSCDLFILEEVEEEPKFKPFDKVLVRDNDGCTWKCNLYSHFNFKQDMFVCGGFGWRQCIPYDGNEHLVGTTNSPNTPE